MPTQSPPKLFALKSKGFNLLNGKIKKGLRWVLPLCVRDRQKNKLVFLRTNLGWMYSNRNWKSPAIVNYFENFSIEDRAKIAWCSTLWVDLTTVEAGYSLSALTKLQQIVNISNRMQWNNVASNEPNWKKLRITATDQQSGKFWSWSCETTNGALLT